jgi:hypothetical protein
VVHPRNVWAVSILVTNNPLHTLWHWPNRVNGWIKLSFYKRHDLKPWQGANINSELERSRGAVSFWNPDWHSYGSLKKC